ncbi:hypothetical protein N7449_010435 [Penicillium cf. viridicatum]|uniref:Uncharacterized protein n=1 Tax=Penicillium cf. viridicatum TaxID=2972119 RepID=A0A9W9J4D6_9EURO|nr:hypothetical protein N7449_010435 [Penicillium cf. viridicatum]
MRSTSTLIKVNTTKSTAESRAMPVIANIQARSAGGGNGQAQVYIHGGRHQDISVTMPKRPISLGGKTYHAREEQWLSEGDPRQTESRENSRANGPSMVYYQDIVKVEEDLGYTVSSEKRSSQFVAHVSKSLHQLWI